MKIFEHLARLSARSMMEERHNVVVLGPAFEKHIQPGLGVLQEWKSDFIEDTSLRVVIEQLILPLKLLIF